MPKFRRLLPASLLGLALIVSGCGGHPDVERQIAVSTVAARAADLEKPERIAELRRAVKVPEGGDDSYFFLILSSGDMTRYYPFRIAAPK